MTDIDIAPETALDSEARRQEATRRIDGAVDETATEQRYETIRADRLDAATTNGD